MEKKDFEKKIGELFSVKLIENSTVDLELIKVEPLKRHDNVPYGRNEPFSLIFLGPETHHLPDDTYAMTTKGWEEKLIFVSAFKLEPGKGIFYDSVFN